MYVCIQLQKFLRKSLAKTNAHQRLTEQQRKRKQKTKKQKQIVTK